MNTPNDITLQDVKNQANLFLESYHSSLTLPVPIEDIAELKLGLKIILISGLIKNFGVNAFINQNFDSIVIDEGMYTKQPERIRFTIAEEIGHLFLHKDWYSKDGPKGLEEYITWQEKLDNKLFDYIERQARTFASMVLMPEKVLKERWDQFVSQNRIPDPCSVFDLPDTFPELAQEFEVTADSLLVRLSFLKLVTVPDGFWKKVRRK